MLNAARQITRAIFGDGCAVVDSEATSKHCVAIFGQTDHKKKDETASNYGDILGLIN